VPTKITWQIWASELASKLVAAHLDILSRRVSIRIRKTRYESYPYIPDLKVVVRFNVTA